MKLLNSFFFLSFLLVSFSLFAVTPETKTLRESIEKSKIGDYIVTLQNKTYTLLKVTERSPGTLIMEEITIPSGKVNNNFSWKEWMKQGAPHHTNWIKFTILLANGRITDSYSRSPQGWSKISLTDSFLPTLLNLKFSVVPDTARRRVGNSSGQLWNPPMVVEGKQIPGVIFDVWRALWPKDGSILANKTIDIYLPREADRYPVHFPYWLQIQGGVIGNTHIRIVDSGTI